MARQAPAGPFPLYPNQFVVAEFGGTLLRQHHGQADPAWSVSVRGRIGSGDWGLYCPEQYSPETVCVDEIGGNYSGKGPSGKGRT